MRNYEYRVHFVFIEKGEVRETYWTGRAFTGKEAEKKARDWFGFDKDGIEVTSSDVEKLPDFL